MKSIMIKIIGVVITLTASYLLALHYAFQWYTSLLLGVLIFNVIVGLNLLIASKKLKVDSSIIIRPLLFVAIVLCFIVIPKYNSAKGYESCNYPPFKLIEKTRLDFRTELDTYYIEDSQFTGFISNHWDFVEAYDIESDKSYEIAFENEQTSLVRIHKFAYINGYIYISGENLHDNKTTSGSDWSLNRYNLKTEEMEFLFDSEEYIYVNSYADKIFVSLEVGVGRREFQYDRNFNLLDTVNLTIDYIYRVDTFGDLEVVQKESGIYLYKDNRMTAKFQSSYGDYTTSKYIYFYEDEFYITTPRPINGHYTDVFDAYGIFERTMEDYVLDSPQEYVLFSDHYVIHNGTGDFSSSPFTDEDGVEICEDYSYDDLKIIYLNNKLYSFYNDGLYEVEEVEYTSPILFDNPQHGLIYWISIVVIAYLVVRKKPFIL